MTRYIIHQSFLITIPEYSFIQQIFIKCQFDLSFAFNINSQKYSLGSTKSLLGALTISLAVQSFACKSLNYSNHKECGGFASAKLMSLVIWKGSKLSASFNPFRIQFQKCSEIHTQ